MQLWAVEKRLRELPEAEWQRVHIPCPSDEPMTEDEADQIIRLYTRVMPLYEYRKMSVEDDIPF